MKKEFKKAVDTEKLSGLTQPKSFMNNDEKNNKTWSDYSEIIKTEQDEYNQVLYTVAVEPAMKEAIQIAGKKLGRTKGGAKSIVRNALLNYFEEHPELFD
ncbi:hypothetical protein [Lactococcus formosensis]|uniref:hypothetical protein n=1 Tax=Lactococcus formosensis TaxID=1281486 RepID=UPI0022E889DB|nr:hypothetical protein [Lactococcus formosensis]